MGFSRRSSGAWPGLILAVTVGVGCGDDGPGGSGGAVVGGTANAGSANDAGSSGNAGSSGSGGTAGTAGTAGSTTDPGGSTGNGDAGAGLGGAAGGEGPGSAGGEGGAENPASGGEAGEIGAGGGPPVFTTASKLDLLFVVDNSISMADKQELLAASIPALVERLVKPWCTGVGDPVPPNEDGSCPVNTVHEYGAVEDLHVGVITSSLGSQGGQVCASSVTGDDKAHLVGDPAIRTGVTSWNDSGFLKWDPTGVANPPGESDSALFAEDLAAMVVAAGETGCGYEAPLEAMYRFLVDPEPPLSVSVVNSVTTPSGIDDALLSQRAAFIRPDSAVMAIVISDENDCSIIDSGQGWLVGLQSNSGQPFYMPRATAACAADPNDPCCRSCATNEAGGPPNGCGTLAADSECTKGSYTLAEENLNLRCFEQKRRFGFDLLQPLSRYVTGLTSAQVKNRAGELVDNPLFAGGRDPNLVMLGVITGLPWQDVAVDPDPAADLDFLSTEQLTLLNRWSVIVGNVSEHIAPLDPFMVESVAARSGTNPITDDPIVASSSTDPTATINGHESAVTNGDDLQYACIFPLVEPVDCSLATYSDACDCFPEDVNRNRPVCQPPGGGATGSTQYYGKAYPGLRQLDVARQLATQSAVASICPRNSEDVLADDYGYYAALRALQARLAGRLSQ